MFISNCPSGYNRDGEQYAGPGDFLVLMQGESEDCQAVKAVVVRTRLRQFGHFMMGRAKISDYEFSLSGSYGADGLICQVPDDIYRNYGLLLPQELYDAWSKGGGHNSDGSEAPDMRKWALENLKELKARPKLPEREFIGSPNIDGMDDSDISAFYESTCSRRLSLPREHYPGKPQDEAAKAWGAVRQYAHWALEARKMRREGHIEHALYLEGLGQEQYDSLPEWARW